MIVSDQSKWPCVTSMPRRETMSGLVIEQMGKSVCEVAGAEGDKERKPRVETCTVRPESMMA